MINELWTRFPRLLEQNINGLLEGATPSKMKAFHLYKACKSEGLTRADFNEFADHLDRFFQRPKFDRTKSAFDSYLNKPMDHKLFEEFYLDFRTADIRESSVYEIASWAHNIMRLRNKRSAQTEVNEASFANGGAASSTKSDDDAARSFSLGAEAITSLDVMNRTLKSITNPSFYAKARDIEFDDFSHAWKKTVTKMYGQKFDSELRSLVEELDRINVELKLTEKQTAESGLTPVIPLTQLEIDWVVAIHAAAIEEKPVPKFPLPQGPQKRMLLELERVVTLYQIVQITSQPELLRHRANIRVTLLDRCDVLLGRKANLIAA